MSQSNARKPFLNTQTMVRLAILGAFAFLLTFLVLPLPIFPAFLKLDPSDIPAIIAALSFGPAGGVLVQLIKCLTDALTSNSGGIGQLANFIAGTAYILPLGMIYQGKRSLRRYLIGAAFGSLCMIVTACLFNYFVLIPAYAAAFTGGIDGIIGMASQINAAVVNLETLILLTLAPFNLLKAVLISLLGYLLYRPLLPLLRRV